VTVQLAAGESKAIDLSLSREKTSVQTGIPKHGMAEWEDPAGWVRDGNWFVHKGGNFVLYRTTPAAGSFVFTGWLKKGRRLQWVVNRTDEKNYALFQLDKKFFYRNQVVNGKQSELSKVPHGLNKQEYYTLEVEVSLTGVVHKLHDGEKWITLDEWTGAGRNFSAGKFGFYIPGSDQVAISNFNFTPR
jgi:hypothetical protein